MIIRITFTESAKGFILDLFDKGRDRKGYIIDKKTRNRILAEDGKEIKVSEFGGIIIQDKNDPIFFRNDIISMIHFSDLSKGK